MIIQFWFWNVSPLGGTHSQTQKKRLMLNKWCIRVYKQQRYAALFSIHQKRSPSAEKDLKGFMHIFVFIRINTSLRRRRRKIEHTLLRERPWFLISYASFFLQCDRKVFWRSHRNSHRFLFSDEQERSKSIIKRKKRTISSDMEK